jgi:hypothetical protein
VLMRRISIPKYTQQKGPARNVARQDMRRRIAERISSVKNVEKKGTLLIVATIGLVGQRKELKRIGSVAEVMTVAAVKVFTAKIGQRQDKKG